MKKPLKAFIAFFGLNGKEKRDVFFIIISYLRVSWLIRCYPLRKYYHKYFVHDITEPFDFSPYRNEIILIKKVIKQMPGKHTCLKESIIVHLLFKKKGLDIPLYLGVSTEKEFLAHAWYDKVSSNGYNQVNIIWKKGPATIKKNGKNQPSIVWSFHRHWAEPGQSGLKARQLLMVNFVV